MENQGNCEARSHKDDGPLADIKQAIESLSPEEAKALLLEIAQMDAHCRRELLARFDKPDVESDRAAISSGIWNAMITFGDGGWIDYSHAYAFEREVSRVIASVVGPSLRAGRYAHVFELTKQILHDMQQIEKDDSDGFYDDLLNTCTDYWDEALAHGDAALEQNMFGWLRAFCASNPWPGNDDADVYPFQSSEAEDYLITRFAGKPGFAQDFISLADEKLAEITLRGDDVAGFFSKSICSRWACVRLRAMDALESPIEEMESFAAPYMSLRDVRQLFVDAAVDSGDLPHAIRLLEEGQQNLDDKHYVPREEIAAEEQLATLYFKVGENGKAQASVRALAAKGRSSDGDHLRWFRTYKKTFTGGEWPRERDRLFAEVEDAALLRSYCAEEGLVDRLMDSLLSDGGGFGCSDALKYKELLQDKYAPELLSMMRKEAFRRLENTAPRVHYQHTVEFMAEMLDIPGGKAEVAKMVQRLRATYPRRRALIDELRTLG